MTTLTETTPTKAVTSAEGVRYLEVNKLRLAYETFGAKGAPMVLLIHGLATQMLAWPTALCEAIAGHDYRVVRFDNRDIGLSSTVAEQSECVCCVAFMSQPSWFMARRIGRLSTLLAQHFSKSNTGRSQ